MKKVEKRITKKMIEYLTFSYGEKANLAYLGIRSGRYILYRLSRSEVMLYDVDFAYPYIMMDQYGNIVKIPDLI